VEVIFPDVDLPPEDAPEMQESDGDEVADADVGEDGDDADDPVDEVSDPSPRRADVSRRPRTPRAEPTIDVDAINRDVAQQLLIAGIRPGSANSAFNALQEGAALEDAASIFAAVEGTEVASTEVGTMHQRDGREATNRATEGIGSLRRRPGSTGRRPTDPFEEVIVTHPGRPPILEPPTVDGPPFNSRELIRRLRGRMGAVRRCYDNILTHGNPDAEGRITLEMQVMPPGHLSGVQAIDNTTGSDALAACVVRAVRTVRVSNGPESPALVEFPVVLVRQN